MTSEGCGVLLSLAFLSLTIRSWCLAENVFKLASAEVIDTGSCGHNGSPSTNDGNGKQWAVLVAGAKGYGNYRHQANVCHAYQLLKKGGLKDENIIVFMYDDIAFDKQNPRPGVIINKPNGTDVYHGVPKDYTGENVNVGNFYAVLLGNKTALTGGSGKVLDSGPNDHIFIYYSDHGSPGILGMPSGVKVYAKDLIDVLQKKHAANGYKSMVIYLEACDSGSMFEGVLPNNLSIYATTAANSHEMSFATYCPDVDSFPPPLYTICLGDLYSVSWMEDCEAQDLRKETLEKQYETVRIRTNKSHVMQYGDMSHSQHFLFTYMGADPSNGSYTSIKDKSPSTTSRTVSQYDTDLLHYQHEFHRAPAGSHEKLEAQRQLVDEIAYRKQVDYNINKIGELLFESEKSSGELMKVRPSGQPLVDDWDCFKTLVRTYENQCGPLSTYGRKYTRAIANMCNAGVTVEKMVAASDQTCSQKHHF